MNCSICFDTGITEFKTVVRSSYPDAADAKLTPVRRSSFERFGCREGGIVYFIPRRLTTKSGMSFPFENLPIGTWSEKSRPYGTWFALKTVLMKLLFLASTVESPKTTMEVKLAKV